MSAGEKSRVALAKALINEPAVLLLDEPTASMDPDTAAEMLLKAMDELVPSGQGVFIDYRGEPVPW